MSSPWVIEQIGGSKRRVELAGWNAPHGRPRQGAVVRPAVSQRATRTRYPGGDGSNVTRHVFGPDFPDLELKGRFRRGAVQAQNLSDNLRAIAAEGQEVRVSWGKLLVCNGFIREYNPGYEGTFITDTETYITEIEWTLTIEVDSYPDLLQKKPVGKPKKPTDFSDRIKDNLLRASIDLSGVSFTGDVFDLLSSAIDVVTGFVNDLSASFDALTEWKDATLAQLNRIRGACANVIRAGQGLRELVESIPVEASQIGARFNELDAMTTTPSVQSQLQSMLTETRDADQQAERAIVGRTKTTYVAKGGDTWESMSTKFYNSPGRAGDIRDANLAGPGEQVRAGQEYLIPE